MKDEGAGLRARLGAATPTDPFAQSGALAFRTGRGLLAEFGVIVAQSDLALRRSLADLDAQVGLPAEFKELLRDLAEHWSQLRVHLDACDVRIAAHARDDERCVRLRAIVGIGPITADAAVATVGDAREFKHGRQMAAWLGLVPTQHASSGHTVGPDQLSWRCVSTHAADPGHPQRLATGERRGDR